MASDEIKNKISWVLEKGMILFSLLFGLALLWIMIDLLGWWGLGALIGAFILFGIVKTFFFLAVR